jgi:hypothetical protein
VFSFFLLLLLSVLLQARPDSKLLQSQITETKEAADDIVYKSWAEPNLDSSNIKLFVSRVLLLSRILRIRSISFSDPHRRGLSVFLFVCLFVRSSHYPCSSLSYYRFPTLAR